MFASSANHESDSNSIGQLYRDKSSGVFVLENRYARLEAL